MKVQIQLTLKFADIFENSISLHHLQTILIKLI